VTMFGAPLMQLRCPFRLRSGGNSSLRFWMVPRRFDLDRSDRTTITQSTNYRDHSNVMPQGPAQPGV